MKSLWNHVWTGVAIGLVIVLAAVTLFGLTLKWGSDLGAERTRQDYISQGGARYVVLVLDGHEYKGWLK